MKRADIFQEGLEVGELLKQLSEDDQNRIEGIVIGYHAARKTAAQPPIFSTAPQPTTT